MRAKALAAVVLWGAVGCRAGQVQNAPGPDLQSFYGAHQWFALRDALAGRTGPALYRGAVAAAFNRQAEAEAILKPLLSGESDLDANEAAKWLAYMYVRLGQYKKAATLMEGNSGQEVMIRTLSNQAVGAFAPAAVAGRIFHRRLFLPVSINGQPGEFFLDSDANFSFVSESEARSLGLTVRGSDATIHGVTGGESAFRVAVAEHVQIGNADLQNVVFLVLPDSEEIFRNFSAAQQGALGLPVLLALRSIGFNGQGSIEIGSGAEDKNAEPNLCFDGLDPVVQVKFQNDSVPFLLDTGAEVSEIWPPFAKRFPDLVHLGKSGSKLERGVGGQSRVPAVVLPELGLEIGGFETHVRSAHLLLAPTIPSSQWYYGRLGLDILTLAQQVTIDFESLSVRVQ